jgi:hypothetical protein
MTDNNHDQNEDPTTSLRRVSARDRKTEIRAEALFEKPPTQPNKPRTESRPKSTPTASRRPAPRKSNRRANLISVLFALLTVLMLAYMALLWVNPFTPLNPLPPFTPLPLIITATPPPVPTATPVLGRQSFTLSPDGVTYAAHRSGCAWAGIAGEVRGVGRYRVRITSPTLEAVLYSGTALTYGAGGYELKLFDAPLQGSVTVQLFGADDIPVSDAVRVELRDTCEENLAIVDFIATE